MSSLKKRCVCVCMWCVCVRVRECVGKSVLYAVVERVHTCMYVYMQCLSVCPPVNLHVSLLLLCPICCVYVCHMKANASSKSRACTKKKNEYTHRQRSPRASTLVCLNESYNSFGLRGRWNEDKPYRLKLFSSCCTAVACYRRCSFCCGICFRPGVALRCA
jgi:hypothetical protein